MFFLEGGRFQFGSGFEAICRMRGGGCGSGSGSGGARYETLNSDRGADESQVSESRVRLTTRVLG